MGNIEEVVSELNFKIALTMKKPVKGSINALLCRARGYRDLNYLLLKAPQLAASKTGLATNRRAT
jgi:hypothetical protein